MVFYSIKKSAPSPYKNRADLNFSTLITCPLLSTLKDSQEKPLCIT
jgi:hypothetical protein